MFNGFLRAIFGSLRSHPLHLGVLK